ncbi:MAG: hypothetical protein EPN82_02995 [Bacteroidetes bacterium]|nr:MAG: hypothetical protein EPN82_02995 [Bacteroidota bacterium]
MILMFLGPSVFFTCETQEPLSFSPMSIVMLLLLVIPTLVLGIWYGPLLEWANKSVGLFLGN